MDNLYCIETQNLNFQFNNQVVLKNINLRIPYRSIFGFLGHNGAGKTTTIKLLLNLLSSNSDNIFLFQQSIKKNRKDILKKIGSLIEQPALYHHLTAWENLYNRSILLKVKKQRIEEVLDMVGLTKSAHIKTDKFSLGMKQRLGIALALLPDPELLILDEPTNGLDPQGILDIRQLLKDLTENHGKTVFVSSHLLSEVEKIATQVGILHQGNLLFQGSISELANNRVSLLEIEADNIEIAIDLLITSGYEAKKVENKITVPYPEKNTIAKINKLLVDNQISIYSLTQKGQNLEQLFLDLTNS